MECNSENTSDASRVVLEGKFLLLLSVFVTRNKTFWPMQNYFVLHFFTFFFFTTFSCVMNSMRKEGKAEESRHLIWTADWSGKYNTPTHTQNTIIIIFLSVFAVMKVVFWNEDNSALFLIARIHSIANSKS